MRMLRRIAVVAVVLLAVGGLTALSFTPAWPASVVLALVLGAKLPTGADATGLYDADID